MFKRKEKTSTAANAAYDYVTSYNTLVDTLSKEFDEEEAMERSVGQGFAVFGALEVLVLEKYGLKDDSYVIDVGCGSGRLAKRLSVMPSLRYLGTDVVQKLLDYANRICKRKDFTFKAVTDIVIPEKDEKADMVCFFSVITHLLHEQSYVYLEEAIRVLKPGGRIVFSFLQLDTETGAAVFEGNVSNIKNKVPPTHLNMFLHPDDVHLWAEKLGVDVVAMHRGDEKFIEVTGDRFEPDLKAGGKHPLGQSVCVLEKPA